MCGLVGIAGNLKLEDEATMKRLLVLDVFRGMDSTGFAVHDKTTKDTKIVKIASHPLDLFDSKRFVDVLHAYKSDVFLGHNRFATKGAVNAENAHPYRFGHIVGAHNGTLDVMSWRALEEALGEKTDVDSQAVFACIAKLGIEETVKMLSGAWALTWINTEDNTLNFLRNKERPLWYASSEAMDRLFWASEYHMIQAATGMSSTGYKLLPDDKGHVFFQTEVDWHYKFDLVELAKTKTEPLKPKIKMLKGKEAVVSTASSPFQGGVWKNGRYESLAPGNSTTNTGTQYGGTSRTTPGAVGTSVVPFSDTNRVVTILTGNSDPYGKYVTRSDFDRIAKYGCSFCSTDVSWGDEGIAVYPQKDQVFCPDCNGGNNTRVYVTDEVMAA